MVSKKEKKRWQKYIQTQATLTDLKLIHLMLKEMEFERRMRNKALKMAKKRKSSAYIA